MRKPTPLFRAIVAPGVWLVRRRCRRLAAAYFATVEPLLLALARS